MPMFFSTDDDYLPGDDEPIEDAGDDIVYEDFDDVSWDTLDPDALDVIDLDALDEPIEEEGDDSLAHPGPDDATAALLDTLDDPLPARRPGSRPPLKRPRPRSEPVGVIGQRAADADDDAEPDVARADQAAAGTDDEPTERALSDEDATKPPAAELDLDALDEPLEPGDEAGAGEAAALLDTLDTLDDAVEPEPSVDETTAEAADQEDAQPTAEPGTDRSDAVAEGVPETRGTVVDGAVLSETQAHIAGSEAGAVPDAAGDDDVSDDQATDDGEHDGGEEPVGDAAADTDDAVEMASTVEHPADDAAVVESGAKAAPDEAGKPGEAGTWVDADEGEAAASARASVAAVAPGGSGAAPQAAVAPPIAVYRAQLALPPGPGAKVLELREVGQIHTMPPPGIALSATFRADELPAVQAALGEWARRYLPLQIELVDIVAEVRKTQQYVAAWLLAVTDELHEAQRDLQSLLASIITPPSAVPMAFTNRLTIGSSVPPTHYPALIGAMQRDFEPLAWHVEAVALVRMYPQVSPGEWDVVEAFD